MRPNCLAEGWRCRMRISDGSRRRPMQHLSSKETSPGPAVGLWRIVGCLTPDQACQFAREIKLLASARFPEQSFVQPRMHAAEGVRMRHSQWCPGRQDAACGCSPRWEAWVYSRKDKGKIRKTFSERWQAKAWRHEQLDLASIGRLGGSEPPYPWRGCGAVGRDGPGGADTQPLGTPLQAERATHDRGRLAPVSGSEPRREAHGRSRSGGLATAR